MRLAHHHHYCRQLGYSHFRIQRGIIQSAVRPFGLPFHLRRQRITTNPARLRFGFRPGIAGSGNLLLSFLWCSSTVFTSHAPLVRQIPELLFLTQVPHACLRLSPNLFRPIHSPRPAAEVTLLVLFLLACALHHRLSSSQSAISCCHPQPLNKAVPGHPGQSPWSYRHRPPDFRRPHTRDPAHPTVSPPKHSSPLSLLSVSGQ